MSDPIEPRGLKRFLNMEKLEDRTTPAAITDPFVAGQVLVGLDPATAPAVIDALKQSSLATGAKHLGFNVYKINLPASLNVENAIDLIAARPGIRYAEPDYLRKTSEIPNDPSFADGTLYGLNNYGQNGGTAGADISAVAAWDTGRGNKTKIVAVLDDGFDYTHPDLAANAWVNPGEIPGNNIDDDNNGYVDDIHGADISDNDGNPAPVGDESHGTHVSGTIGAVGNNGVGVVGSTWNTRLMGVRFLGGGGGSASGEIAAIEYAVKMGANIINGSYGGPGTSQGEQDAFAGARAAGVLCIIAAGNETTNNDVTPSYPAFLSTMFDNIVTIAATDRNDKLASFSNYGKTSVQLAAPGVDIISTEPGNTYGFKSGTSMATPNVAGAVAAFWDENPDLTYGEVADALLISVDQLPNLDGIVETGGRLNFEQFMAQGKVTSYYATGAGAGGGPLVNVYRTSGRLQSQFFAYAPVFTGGVRVAAGDVTGDGIADIITAAGTGGGPHVKVFDAKSGTEIGGFFSADPSFNGGLYVSTGDVNGDGKADIIVSTDTGGGPRVTVFSRSDDGSFANIADFFAYDLGFAGGVRVAVGDVDADGLADVITAAGRGGGPHVKVFGGAQLIAGDYENPIRSFFAGNPSDTRGLFIAANKMSSQSHVDLIVSSGSDSPTVRIYNGETLNLDSGLTPPRSQGGVAGLVVDQFDDLTRATHTFNFPGNLIPPAAPINTLSNAAELKKPIALNGYQYGVRVASTDLNRDGVGDLILTSGPADSPRVTLLNGKTFTELRSYLAYGPGFFGGVFVGANGTTV